MTRSFLTLCLQIISHFKVIFSSHHCVDCLCNTQVNLNSSRWEIFSSQFKFDAHNGTWLVSSCSRTNFELQDLMPTLPVPTKATWMPTLATKATIMGSQLTKGRWVISVGASACGGDHMLRCHQCHLNPAHTCQCRSSTVEPNVVTVSLLPLKWIHWMDD